MHVQALSALRRRWAHRAICCARSCCSIAFACSFSRSFFRRAFADRLALALPPAPPPPRVSRPPRPPALTPPRPPAAPAPVPLPLPPRLLGGGRHVTPSPSVYNSSGKSEASIDDVDVGADDSAAADAVPCCCLRRLRSAEADVSDVSDGSDGSDGC